MTADLRQAEADLDTAQAAHLAVPTRLPLAAVNPGKQVLDIQTKLLTHAIRMAAFKTMTALARAIRGLHRLRARRRRSPQPGPTRPHRQRRHRPPLMVS